MMVWFRWCSEIPGGPYSQVPAVNLPGVSLKNTINLAKWNHISPSPMFPWNSWKSHFHYEFHHHLGAQVVNLWAFTDFKPLKNDGKTRSTFLQLQGCFLGAAEKKWPKIPWVETGGKINNSTEFGVITYRVISYNSMFDGWKKKQLVILWSPKISVFKHLVQAKAQSWEFFLHKTTGTSEEESILQWVAEVSGWKGVWKPTKNEKKNYGTRNANFYYIICCVYVYLCGYSTSMYNTCIQI